MKPKISNKGQMTIVGMECRTTHKNNTIPQLWGEFMPRAQEIQQTSNLGVSFGVCFHEDMVEDFDENSEFSYLAGLEVENTDNIPEGMKIREIPAAKYAVFTHKGLLDTLGLTYQYIYGEWARETSHKLATDRDQLELYDKRFDPTSADSEMDLYIPLEG